MLEHRLLLVVGALLLRGLLSSLVCIDILVRSSALVVRSGFGLGQLQLLVRDQQREGALFQLLHRGVWGEKLWLRIGLSGECYVLMCVFHQSGGLGRGCGNRGIKS